MKSSLMIIGAVTAVAIAAFLVFSPTAKAPVSETDNLQNEPRLVENEAQIRPFGSVTLALGEKAVFEGVSIRPLAIVEDSRCPLDVQCIQAGAVRVTLETVSGLGTSTDTLALGKTLTTEAQQITFGAVSPEPVSTETIPNIGYRLTFEVSKRNMFEEAALPEPLIPVAALPAKKCYIGGCSSQLCSEDPGMMSTCEYKEAYACYKTAACEVQSDGACGWTPSPQLNACLQDAQDARIR